MPKTVGWGKKHVFLRPEGQVRQSQVITTYGAGALIDLVDQAVLMGGLDFWSYGSGKGVPILQEPRLRDALAESFRAAGRELSFENAFREPPAGDGRQPARAVGIQVLEMPRWFVCQNPRCRALVRSDGLDLKGGRYRHQCEQKKGTECVPVRFVGACRRGHVQEFPWIYFAHRHADRQCAAPSLRLLEGATGDFSEVIVQCACGAREKLSGATVLETNPPCEGKRPWLGVEGDEPCDEKLRLLVRTASNGYFPQVVSALSLPEKGRELEVAVRTNWDVLQAATRETLGAFRAIPKVKAALFDTSDDEVLKAVQAVKQNLPVERKPIRTAEFEQLIDSKREAPGDLPRAEEGFYARTFQPKDGVPEKPDKVAQIVLVRKLREVRAQIGFTRIEPVTPDLQGEFDLGVQSQVLGLTTDWVPACEIRGEGVFLRLDEKAVREWEDRPAVLKRGRELLSGFDAWTEPLKNKPEFPGVRFYLLHSLAHLLVSSISLECGYSASALRERIYCAPSNAELPMAGILLSTGSAGTEGTLGGLVEQGREIREHLRLAFDMGALCSNDPVCASHSPEKDPAERYLEGAACHGCLFIAECSCERFNRYLDRALVVPAIGHDPELAFFSERP
ncbi:MAG: DrmB family protein [Vicinamibacteria bacterium]